MEWSRWAADGSRSVASAAFRVRGGVEKHRTGVSRRLRRPRMRLQQHWSPTCSSSAVQLSTSRTGRTSRAARSHLHAQSMPWVPVLWRRARRVPMLTGKGSAYAACCAHDSSCVRIRIRTQSACPMLIRTVRHTVGSYDIMLYIDYTYAKRTTCSWTTWRWGYGCQQHAALDYTERSCIT